MNCPKCGAANEAGLAVCGTCGAALTEAVESASVPVPAAPNPTAPKYVFKDLKVLTRWLQGLLIAHMVVSVIAGVSRFGEVQTLQLMRDGAFSSEAEMMAAAEASDARQQLIGYGTFGLLIVIVIVFAMWIYRSCANVHALGARDLKITPGWSVGWFFVPIANLWMPYKGMSQIMRASRNPMNWEGENAGPLVGWWWFFYLFANITNTIVVRIAESAETIEELITASSLTTGSYALDLLSTGAALMLVRTINKHQSQAADRSLSAVFA